MTENPHIGSSLDNLLEETGDLNEVEVAAIERVIAWQDARRVMTALPDGWKLYVTCQSMPVPKGRILLSLIERAAAWAWAWHDRTRNDAPVVWPWQEPLKPQVNLPRSIDRMRP